MSNIGFLDMESSLNSALLLLLSEFVITTQSCVYNTVCFVRETTDKIFCQVARDLPACII